MPQDIKLLCTYNFIVRDVLAATGMLHRSSKVAVPHSPWRRATFFTYERVQCEC